MQTQTSDALKRALHQASAHQYQDALSTIRVARQTDPRNVYILAIERQLATLLEPDESSRTKNLIADTSETFELLQVLMTQALAGSKEIDAASDQAAAVIEKHTHAAVPKRDRDNAVATLKKEYFARAEACLTSGDYQGALFEVHRIYVLDPVDEIARAYEARIQRRLQLEPPAAPDPIAVIQVEETTTPTEPLVFGDDIPPDEQAQSEDFRIVRPLETPPPFTLRRDRAKQRSLKKMITTVSVVVLVAGSGYYILWKRGADEKLMARFTENPASALAQAGDQQDNQPADVGSDESIDSRIKSKVEAPQKREETPIPKFIPNSPLKAPSRASSQPERSTGSRPNIALRSSEESNPAAPLEPKSGADLRQSGNAAQQSGISQSAGNSQQDSSAKNIASLLNQPLKPVDAMPMAKSSQESERPRAAGQFIAVQKEPQLLRLEKVRFSQALLERGVEGEVIVQVKISTAGRPLQARILKSSNPDLDDAVIEAVMNSDYAPGAMSTGPVVTWATIPFTFKK